MAFTAVAKPTRGSLLHMKLSSFVQSSRQMVSNCMSMVMMTMMTMTMTCLDNNRDTVTRTR